MKFNINELDHPEKPDVFGEELKVLDLNDDTRTEEEEEALLDKDPEQEEEEAPYSLFREIVSWIVPLVVAVAIALILKNYVIINANVPTGSMEDTIATKDDLVGFRLSYLFSDPERGDIVIFYYPDDESQLFIKRIIGLPGDDVVIENGKIYINGSEEALQEDYLKEDWVVSAGPYHFEVPEDCYLMLGDNRNDSLDARYWTNTYVTKDKIVGKAIFIYFPFNHMKILN